MDITKQHAEAINKYFEQLNKMAEAKKVNQEKLDNLIDKMRDVFCKDRWTFWGFDDLILKLAVEADGYDAMTWYETKIVNLTKKAFELLVSKLTVWDGYSDNRSSYMSDATLYNDIDKVEVLINNYRVCEDNDALYAINLAKECDYKDIENLIKDNFDFELEYDEDEENEIYVNAN